MLMVMTSASGGRPSIGGFLSYAHADRRVVERFRRLLAPRLEILRAGDVSVWLDDHILVGQPWDEAIRAAIARADFGLLLLSPALLSRPYVRDVEIPLLMDGPGTRVMPVGLQRVDLARADLRGIEAHQIFRLRTGPDHEPRWFSELAGENPARFCDALVAEIADQVLGVDGT